MTKLMFCRMSELNQLTGNVRGKNKVRTESTWLHKEEEVFSFSSSHTGSPVTLSFSPVTSNSHTFQSISQLETLSHSTNKQGIVNKIPVLQDYVATERFW